jgi:hypothetical protein
MAKTVMPSSQDIFKIPLATAGEFELSDKEAARLRSQIYSLNKHHVHGWRWRTLRNGPLLLVWRVK